MDGIQFWTISAANGIVLDQYQLKNIERFHTELEKWNEKVNMISRQDVDNIYERHILHSLSIMKYVKFPPKAKILDVGTGGGFPGIPLKIALPEVFMLLVDSITKKIKVTEMLAKHTGLRNIETLNARVESLQDIPKYLRSFDFIVARAVAPLVELVSWTEALLKPKGQIILLKGGDLADEIAEAKKKFQNLIVEEHIIEMTGAEWFSKDKKKVLICRFA